ncbi:response regulator [sulfur-oxidizing endosymbiont of Gigantopelta aegis]|uniref:response regulator n=1 Tax=sulfur-oxidizing endosymbiont of Gigantopelta aegis TaxID=2794934 RepID=UPI0018DBD8F0|nr:response regulator [sulfur-oxidizing endosymbiont of Gigantopelta aegis]
MTKTTIENNINAPEETTKVRILITDDNKQIHRDFISSLSPRNAAQNAADKALDNLIDDVFDSPSNNAQENQTNISCPYEFELDFAFQGEEASAMVDKAFAEGKPYSMVFMDVRMPPGWTGLETIQHIWKKHPELEMVICTAYSDYTWEDFSKILGISHRLLLLKKPFDKMEAKQLALSLSMKSSYYNQYLHHIETLEEAVKSRTQALEAEKIKAEAANRAKSTFLANMSHELRTPLNGILGYADLMSRENELNNTQNKHLNIIQRCGTHLLSLINNVLDLSKIESGLMEKSETHFNLHQLIDDIQQMLIPRCQRNHLELIVDIDEFVPKVVSGDDRKLRQILINLMANAVKFTPPLGEIRLKVANESLHQILFSIADTGQGIPEQDLETIFQPFRQSQAKSNDDSTGLGLSICTSFVNLLDGELQVESQLGKGSRFYFSIPLPAINSTSLDTDFQQRIVAIDHRGESPAKDWHILVADDNETSRTLCQELLEKIGYQVTVANNGQQALDILHEQKTPSNLVISDVKMPVMDGEELLKQVKVKYPELPIILTSTSIHNARENQLLAHGADTFLAKPIDIEKLLQSIANLIPVRYIYKTVTQQAQQQSYNMDSIHEQLQQLSEQHYQLLLTLVNDGNLKGVRQNAQILTTQTEYKELGNFICEIASKYDTQSLTKLFSRKNSS